MFVRYTILTIIKKVKSFPDFNNEANDSIKTEVWKIKLNKLKKCVLQIPFKQFNVLNNVLKKKNLPGTVKHL